MVHKIGTCIIVLATIINIIGISALFSFISYYEDELNVKIKPKNDFNLDDDNINDNNYINQNKYNNTNHKMNNPQDDVSFNDYNLDKKFIFSSSFYYKSIIILNSFSLFLWILLIFSFFVGENDCRCRCCESVGACNTGNCNCNNNADGGKAILVCLVFICIIIILYYCVKLCGKHFSRYIILSCLIFNNLCIFIFSFLIITRYSVPGFQIVLISLLLMIFNILFIIIPNIPACKRFRFESLVPNESQISNVNNNSAVINNNANNYMNNYPPNQANYAGYPNYQINPNPNNGVYVVPITSNEYNNDNQNIRNENMNNNNNMNSNNQIIDDNGDMGNAPLPAHEVQVKT